MTMIVKKNIKTGKLDYEYTWQGVTNEDYVKQCNQRNDGFEYFDDYDLAHGLRAVALRKQHKSASEYYSKYGTKGEF